MIHNDLRELAARLSLLLDSDPAEAVRQARLISFSSSDKQAMNLRASILVDGGREAKQPDAIAEGVQLFRRIYDSVPDISVCYNLANALASVVGHPPYNHDWLDQQERTREQRAETRRLYYRVSRDEAAPQEIRTQAWANLANQFSRSLRLGEAHDARLAALTIDPTNGVAAGCAARELLWQSTQYDCSELTRLEAIMLAKIAARYPEKVRKYAGQRAVNEFESLANTLGDAPHRSPHTDPFICWVERERLTLSPVVELIDPSLGKLDWLMLPDVLERHPKTQTVRPPPVFAMFNALKAEFILARDLAWRANSEIGWPTTGRFADTLDYASYGPDVAALVLAHRTALDLLDKVAVTANHYFELGRKPNGVYFHQLWREGSGKKGDNRSLIRPVEKAIRGGARALYGLIELAEDYGRESGILHPQKCLRNAGTHRFVVLHDVGNPADIRPADEIEHHSRAGFSEEVRRALRVARSALQMLALAITQHERVLAAGAKGPIGSLQVPDHDWIRGRDEEHK